MTDFEALEAILRTSVARRGEVPLTNSHLLNIVRMARRLRDRRDEQERVTLAEVFEHE